MGEVSRARQCLTGATLAPGTQETLREVQNKRPQAAVRSLLEDVLTYIAESPVKLDRQKFLKSLKSAPRGSSPGLGGCTYEHLRILLDDAVTTELLFDACTSLAQATLPSEISAALMCARLRAIVKGDRESRRRSQGHGNRVCIEAVGGKNPCKAFHEGV